MSPGVHRLTDLIRRARCAAAELKDLENELRCEEVGLSVATLTAAGATLLAYAGALQHELPAEMKQPTPPAEAELPWMPRKRLRDARGRLLPASAKAATA